MNIEIMRNTLYKAYLDDFAQFTSKLGGATSEVMGDLLSFEVNAEALLPLLAVNLVFPLYTIKFTIEAPTSFLQDTADCRGNLV